MTRARILPGVLVLFGFIVLGACGGGSNTSAPPPPQGTTAPVSVTVGDTPPANVTVLSFEVTVLSAVL